MPSDADLTELASTYLTVQRELWPEKVASGELLPHDDASVAKMVESFKQRFLNDWVDDVLEVLSDDLQSAAYLRYSDAGSNSRSNVQQLENILPRARRDNHFIPWALVFCDAAVTGTTAKRRGYEMAKEAMAAPELAVVCLYVDDLGRANRDVIETLALGRMIETLRKRLIGVSDGFDSEIQQAKLLLSLYGYFAEWFIQQLKPKVNRGMNDTFKLGGNLSAPAAGYKLVKFFDEGGHPVLGQDGEQINTLAIDEAQAKVIIHVFDMYVKRLRSPERIARLLNRIRFAKSTTWDGSRVRKLLSRRQYIGIRTFRMTRHVRDSVTGKITTIECPLSEWKIKLARHLKFVPVRLWKAARKRMKMLREIWKKSRKEGANRAEAYPTTIFRPFCDMCKAPMILGRSGKYASFSCPNGSKGKNGCTCRGYKVVGRFETAILNAIREQVLSEANVDRLVESVAVQLATLSAEPRVDTKSIKREIAKVNKAIDGVYNLMGDGNQDLPGARSRLQGYGRQLADLNKQLHVADAQNVPLPKAPTRKQVESYFADLRGLLNGDVPRSADLLRKLVGPIFVRQEKKCGQRGYTWIARFTANLIPALVTVEAGKDCPTKGIWEFLNTRSWTMPIDVEVKIKDMPKYEEIAPEVHEMLARGASRLAIASHLKTSMQYVDFAEHFSNTGERPKWKSKSAKKQPKSTDKIAVTAKDIAAEVARLRDKKKMSWAKIGAWLLSEKGITAKEAKLRQAYDHAHPERTQDAVEKGQPVKRGEVSCVDEAMHRRIRKELAKGTKPKEIAKMVGCHLNTVYREKAQIRAERAA